MQQGQGQLSLDSLALNHQLKRDRRLWWLPTKQTHLQKRISGISGQQSGNRHRSVRTVELHYELRFPFRLLTAQLELPAQNSSFAICRCCPEQLNHLWHQSRAQESVSGQLADSAGLSMLLLNSVTRLRTA